LQFQLRKNVARIDGRAFRLLRSQRIQSLFKHSARLHIDQLADGTAFPSASIKDRIDYGIGVTLKYCAPRNF
jgi:hypothetical protein